MTAEELNSKYYTIEETAILLNVTKQAIYKMINKNRKELTDKKYLITADKQYLKREYVDNIKADKEDISSIKTEQLIEMVAQTVLKAVESKGENKETEEKQKEIEELQRKIQELEQKHKDELNSIKEENKASIDFYQEELRNKNKIINTLTENISQLNLNLSQEQSLRALEHKELIEMKERQQEQEQEKKSGLFSFFKKKGSWQV